MEKAVLPVGINRSSLKKPRTTKAAGTYKRGEGVSVGELMYGVQGRKSALTDQVKTDIVMTSVLSDKRMHKSAPLIGGLQDDKKTIDPNGDKNEEDQTGVGEGEDFDQIPGGLEDAGDAFGNLTEGVLSKSPTKRKSTKRQFSVAQENIEHSFLRASSAAYSAPLSRMHGGSGGQGGSAIFDDEHDDYSLRQPQAVVAARSSRVSARLVADSLRRSRSKQGGKSLFVGGDEGDSDSSYSLGSHLESLAEEESEKSFASFAAGLEIPFENFTRSLAHVRTSCGYGVSLREQYENLFNRYATMESGVPELENKEVVKSVTSWIFAPYEHAICEQVIEADLFHTMNFAELLALVRKIEKSILTPWYSEFYKCYVADMFLSQEKKEHLFFLLMQKEEPHRAHTISNRQFFELMSAKTAKQNANLKFKKIHEHLRVNFAKSGIHKEIIQFNTDVKWSDFVKYVRRSRDSNVLAYEQNANFSVAEVSELKNFFCDFFRLDFETHFGVPDPREEATRRGMSMSMGSSGRTTVAGSSIIPSRGSTLAPPGGLGNRNTIGDASGNLRLGGFHHTSRNVGVTMASADSKRFSVIMEDEEVTGSKRLSSLKDVGAMGVTNQF